MKIRVLNRLINLQPAPHIHYIRLLNQTPSLHPLLLLTVIIWDYVSRLRQLTCLHVHAHVNERVDMHAHIRTL